MGMGAAGAAAVSSVITLEERDRASLSNKVGRGLRLSIENKEENRRGGGAVVMLSGGLDSATTAWIAKKECNELYAITFDYGQSHRKEIECAVQLGSILGVERHTVIEVPIGQVIGPYSSLFDKDNIPKRGLTRGIPSTWVPQRNSIFLAIAFSWAEVVGADRVYAGMNNVDYSGYPDCRPEFLKAINIALNLASRRFVETGRGITIVTPLVGLSKNRIVALGFELGVPFQNTTSCYVGEEEACGKCDSCQIRLKAFASLGEVDPIKYKDGIGLIR